MRRNADCDPWRIALRSLQSLDEIGVALRPHSLSTPASCGGGAETRAPGVAWLAAAALGTALCATTIGVIAASRSGPDDLWREVGLVLAVATPVAVGLWAWRADEQARFGRLLWGAGCIFFVASLSQSGNEVAYSIGRIGVWLVELTLATIVLMFPSGRLRGRLDRTIVVAFALVVAILYLPTAFLADGYPVPTPYAACRADCPGNAFMALAGEPAFLDSYVYPLRESAVVALTITVVGVLAAHLRRASALLRPMLAPILVVAIARGIVFAAFIVMRLADPAAGALDVIGRLYVFSLPALAVAFFVGLLGRRLRAAASLQALALRLRDPPPPGQVRDLLSETVQDPTLEVVYPERGSRAGWIDAMGRRVQLPTGETGRSATVVLSEGQPVAALVHDSALDEERDLVAAAGSFALAALENQRLSAKVDASLEELEQSRARIQIAADNERLRIERDLHDGAQQRLVALRIRLQLASETAGTESAQRHLLQALAEDVDTALEEVRSLAHGMYPPLLADRGLEEALRAVARAAALPASVHAKGLRRYSPTIESAVYFCCVEALQNAAKHASGASAAWITIQEANDLLRFVVEDDGPGFVEGSPPGVGLTNMLDRLAAVGGELTIGRRGEGSGACVRGEIPLAPSPRGGSARETSL